MSNFKYFISKGRGGIVGEIESITNTLKHISRHKLVKKNWSPTENIYRGVTKILRPFCARVICYQQQNTKKTEELTKLKCGAFDYFIFLNKNDFIDEIFQ